MSNNNHEQILKQMIEEYNETKINPESILSKPKAGWTTFTMGETEFVLSYLVDVPNEWLDTILFAFENKLPFTLHGECEPGDFYCVVNYHEVHIFFDEHLEATYIANSSEIIDVLIKDFSKNLDAWANWGYVRLNEKELKEEKQRLQSKIDKYYEIIEKRKLQLRKHVHEEIDAGSNIVCLDDSFMDNELKEKYYKHRNEKNY